MIVAMRTHNKISSAIWCSRPVDESFERACRRGLLMGRRKAPQADQPNRKTLADARDAEPCCEPALPIHHTSCCHKDIPMTANFAKSLLRRTGLKRTHVAYARMYCERNLLAFSHRRSPRETGRILCYHTVGQPQWGVNDVSPARFRRHIELALNAGLRFVPASVLARNDQDKREIAITFDDGMRSVLTQAAPVLAEYQIPWSLFVVSDWAEGIGAFGHDMVLNWSELEQVMKLGAELGSHSVSHPNFGQLEASRVTDELANSRRMMEARLGSRRPHSRFRSGNQKTGPRWRPLPRATPATRSCTRKRKRPNPQVRWRERSSAVWMVIGSSRRS